MNNVPVDASNMKLLVVGEPVPQMKGGAPYLDRATGQPMWNIPVTLIGDFRAETVELGVPENGFPKGLGVGPFIVPEGLALILFNRKEGGLGAMWRVRSVKLEGGSAALKAAAS